MARTHSSAFAAVNLTQVALTLALTSALITPAWADGLRELDQTIFGMDCAPCAAGVEQGLSKLHGVTAVRVSLNDGKAVVTLAPHSRTTLAQIREVILHNGFTPKEAQATLVGRLRRDGDHWWVETSGERFVLATNGAAADTQAISAATNQEVKLSVRVPEKLTNPTTVQLISFGQGS